MKVLLINAVCGSGSTGRICTDIHDMLVEKGHKVVIAYAHGEPTRVPIEDTYRINDKRGYYVHNIMARLTDRAGFFSTKATKRLINFIKSYQPDLIHLHNLHGFYVNIRVLFEYLASAGVPVVWTLHDCWSFTGHCVHYSYYACNQWISGCKNCPLKHTYPQSLFLDQSKRNYKEKRNLFTAVPRLYITTPSNWLASQVRQSYLKKYKVTPIYNGIDLTIFKPTKSDIRLKYHIAPESTMLLAVANEWSPRKGFDDLVQLNRVLDHSKYQLVIVGLSEKQIASLDHTMIGIRRTSSLEELVKLYSAADVFVNTSYEETMGMVTAEAIACGTPAVVYDQTAVPEIVDKDSGIVVKAGDPNAIYNAIPQALSLDRTVVKVRALEFEVKRQYEKYYQLFLECIGSHE